MRHRRTGTPSRDRSDGDAPQERRSPRRQHRIDLAGAERCQLRQLRHSGVPGDRRARAGQGQRRREAGRRPLGGGHGRGAGHAGMRPPTEHRSGAEMRLLADGTYHLAVGSSEMGNGITTAHKQMAAAVLGVRATDIAIINADTDRTPYDTAHSPARARSWPARRSILLRRRCAYDILAFASRHTEWIRCNVAWRTMRWSAATSGSARCSARRRAKTDQSLRGKPQGLPVAAHDRLQRAGRKARGPSRHRGDPHPAQRARRRQSAGRSIRCSAAASSTGRWRWDTAGPSPRTWFTRPAKW